MVLKIKPLLRNSNEYIKTLSENSELQVIELYFYF